MPRFRVSIGQSEYFVLLDDETPLSISDLHSACFDQIIKALYGDAAEQVHFWLRVETVDLLPNQPIGILREEDHISIKFHTESPCQKRRHKKNRRQRALSRNQREIKRQRLQQPEESLSTTSNPPD